MKNIKTNFLRLLFRNVFSDLYVIKNLKYSTSTKLEYKVSKFGTLKLLNRSPLNVKISSVDPVLYPNQDVLFVSSSLLPSSITCSYEERESVMKVSVEKSTHPSYLFIQLPIKYNVELVKEKGQVLIENLQNEFIKIQIKNSKLIFSNILSDQCEVEGENSDLEGKGTIHTNASIRNRGAGDMNLNKIIGEKLVLETNQGDIEVKSMYVEEGTLTILVGNMKIKHAQKNLKVKIKQIGSLNIENLEGNLEACLEKGEVEMFISDLQDLNVKLKQGNITLKLDEGLNCKYDVKGSEVLISSDLKTSQGQIMEKLNQCQGEIIGKKKEVSPVFSSSSSKQIKLESESGMVKILPGSWLERFKTQNKFT